MALHSGVVEASNGRDGKGKILFLVVLEAFHSLYLHKDDVVSTD
jgi:hypothetical protein